VRCERYVRMAKVAAKQPVEHKPCGRCRLKKPAGKFYINKRNVSGLGSWCKVCLTPLLHVHVASAFC